MSYSRHAERQRHSGDDYSTSSRSSHSSKRSEDRIKRRRERDRDYDRRKERRRSAQRNTDKQFKEDSRHSKTSRSRSKAHRTYNTDTEESDESSQSPGRNLKRRLSSDHEAQSDQDKEKKGDTTPNNSILIKVSPALSPQKEQDSETIGPVLPPHLQKKCCEQGPVLPPHLENNLLSSSADKLTCIGPVLPPLFNLEKGNSESSCATLGPSLPPGMELPQANSDDDDQVVGPMLPQQLIQSNKNYRVHLQLETRAAQVKRKMEGKELGSESSKREQWMIELPPEGTINLGLGPRTFRLKGAPEKGADRSMWTDTPADKLRKQEQALTHAHNEGTSSTAESPPQISHRDKEMEKIVNKHSKKRGKESLLDLHHKQLNKKKTKDKDDGKKEERRPFSREVDLKSHVFDEAQKKSIFKKAQLLDTRFSRGETKYL